MSRSALAAVGSSVVVISCGGSVAPAERDDGGSDDAAVEVAPAEEDAEPLDGIATEDVSDDSALPSDSMWSDTSADTSLPNGPDGAVYGAPPPPPDAAQCEATTTALTPLVTGDACTAVVRLSYTSLTRISWQLVCGPRGPFTEAAARADLEPYLPMPDYGGGVAAYQWQPPTAADPWVLYRTPGDFGGIGVGSATRGKLTFAGGIVWAGAGSITYPSAWGNEKDLGECAELPHGAARGFIPSNEMADRKDAALSVVYRTALVRAMERVHGAVSPWVLGYPRTVGGLDPWKAEWIVFVESSP